MLTRLEIDGFKNLFDVVVDFGPYTCIAGPNAVGKSNLFDAIEFLALIADYPFMEAAQKLRLAGDRPGDPRTLFWYDGNGSPTPMKLAVEMIVPELASDDFGQEAIPSSTYLRYEVELAYVEPRPDAAIKLGGIRLVREELNYITKAEGRARLGWPHSSTAFRDRVVQNRRRGKGYISTSSDPTGVTFQVHQDGGSRGQPRRSSAAPRTVISTVNTADDPTILAARREMQQWRMLALEPTAMRAPDPISGTSTISSSGAHLAGALFRLADSSDNVYSIVANTASALTDVRAVRVDLDPKRDLLTLEAQLGNGPFLPARALSDGTLRFLALSIIEADHEYGGLICMEEPENGIHPAKINAMVDLLHDLSVDPSEAPGPDNPFRQVIVNTHSPRLVAAQRREDLILALPRSVTVQGREVRSLALLPMSKTWRSSQHGYAISKGMIGDYLTQPEDAFEQLEFSEREISELD